MTPGVLGDQAITELAACASAGCRASFAKLVARYEGRLYNFLLRRTGSPHDAEDLTQETFVRAWQHIDRYSPRWAFSTWLFTIGGRLAITQARRRRPIISTAAIDAVPAPPNPGAHGDDGNDPAAIVSRTEEHARLWAIAERTLAEEDRSALWLRYAESMSIRDVARVLGRAPVTIRVMLFRARRTLAAHIAPVAEPSSAPPPAPAHLEPPPRERVAPPTLAGGVR